MLRPSPADGRLLESRDIFAVFMSPGERTIGQAPGTNPFSPSQMLVLTGRRWRVIEVNGQCRELAVRPAHGGAPPSFGGEAQPPADGDYSIGDRELVRGVGKPRDHHHRHASGPGKPGEAAR